MMSLANVAEFQNKHSTVIGYYKGAAGSINEALNYMVQSVKCFRKLCLTDRNVVLMGDFNLPDMLLIVHFLNFSYNL